MFDLLQRSNLWSLAEVLTKIAQHRTGLCVLRRRGPETLQHSIESGKKDDVVVKLIGVGDIPQSDFSTRNFRIVDHMRVGASDRIVLGPRARCQLVSLHAAHSCLISTTIGNPQEQSS